MLAHSPCAASDCVGWFVVRFFVVVVFCFVLFGSLSAVLLRPATGEGSVVSLPPP